MSDFFERARRPPEPAPQRHRTPPRLGPPEGTYEVDPLLFGERPGWRASSGALRSGIQFADGSRATNMGGLPTTSR